MLELVHRIRRCKDVISLMDYFHQMVFLHKIRQDVYSAPHPKYGTLENRQELEIARKLYSVDYSGVKHRCLIGNLSLTLSIPYSTFFSHFRHELRQRSRTVPYAPGKPVDCDVDSRNYTG